MQSAQPQEQRRYEDSLTFLKLNSHHEFLGISTLLREDSESSFQVSRPVHNVSAIRAFHTKNTRMFPQGEEVGVLGGAHSPEIGSENIFTMNLKCLEFLETRTIIVDVLELTVLIFYYI